MLNVEFKVNNQLIGFMNIHNEATLSPGPKGKKTLRCKEVCRYSYTITTTDGTKQFLNIFHQRSDGFEELVLKCLNHSRRTA